jgi:Domain of unknown function (DUF1707)/Cell wall-active antibiotics response 4TMS YvqF
VSEPPALRVSDAEREAAVVALREHAAEGRLTLEEFGERMSSAYGAVTRDELDRLTRDLPSSVPSKRRSTRFVFSVFGSTEREGRLRVRDRVVCLTLFGNVDLDLRQATLEGDVIDVTTIAICGAIDVYVPEGVEVDLRGLAVFGHKGAHGDEPALGAPTVLARVTAFSLFAGIDVWRVPAALARKKLREVIRELDR